MAELEESIDRVIAGPERKSRKISPKEKEVTAYHEAGHAWLQDVAQCRPVHKISIVARGMSLGHTRQLPTEDRYLLRVHSSRICWLLCLATVSLKKLSSEKSAPAQMISGATDLAHKMVTDYGMSDKLGARTFGNKQEMVFLGREIAEQRDYGDEIANLIDEEVHNIIQTAYKTAKDILLKNRDRLTHIAQVLMDKETIEPDELEKLFTEPIDKLETETKKKPAAAKKAAGTVPAAPAVKQPKKRMPDLIKQPKQAPGTA